MKKIENILSSEEYISKLFEIQSCLPPNRSLDQAVEHGFNCAIEWMLNNQQSVAVSDTTEADSSNADGNKKIPSIDWEGLENSAQLAKVRIKNLFNDGNDSDRIDFAFDQLFEKLQDYIK